MCSTVRTSLHGGDQILLMASYTSFTHFDSQPPSSERSFSSQLPLAFLLPISHLNHLWLSLTLIFYICFLSPSLPSPPPCLQGWHPPTRHQQEVLMVSEPDTRWYCVSPTCISTALFGFCTITLARLFVKFHYNKKTGIKWNYFPVFSERCCLFSGGGSGISHFQASHFWCIGWKCI